MIKTFTKLIPLAVGSPGHALPFPKYFSLLPTGDLPDASRGVSLTIDTLKETL